MSSLPLELNFRANPAATPARMEEAMLYIVAWLRRVESVQPEFISVTNQIKALGLERINEILTPIFLAAQQTDEQLSALYQQWLASDVLAELEQSVTAALAGLVIGETIQAHSARLDALAAIDAVAFGRGLLALANAAGLRGAAELGDVATLNKATAAQIRAKTADKLLTASAIDAAGAYVALADGPTIPVDCATFQGYAKVTLGGNRTLENPTNVKQGGWVVEVTNNSFTLSYGSSYRAGGGLAALPTIATGANAITRLYFDPQSDGTICVSANKDVKA